MAKRKLTETCLGGWLQSHSSTAAHQLPRTLFLVLLWVFLYKNISFLMNVMGHQVTQSTELFKILVHVLCVRVLLFFKIPGTQYLVVAFGIIALMQKHMSSYKCSSFRPSACWDLFNPLFGFGFACTQLGSVLLVIDIPLLLELTGGCVKTVVAGYSSGVKTVKNISGKFCYQCCTQISWWEGSVLKWV